MPAGTKFGGLRSQTTLGVLNGACNTTVTVDFVLYNVALPNVPADPRTSSNIVYPRNEGQTNRFGAWQLGSPPANGGPDNVTDANSDLRADPSTLSIQNFPAYLLDAFDPDFVPGVGDNADGGANAMPVVPRAVYGSLTNVLGQWAPMYVVQFEAGALTTLPGPFAKMKTAMGKPSVPVLGDPTATVASPGTVTDLCTPISTTTVLLGQDPTQTYDRAYSPVTGGTVFFLQYTASQRDLDQDGYENSLDTCPKDPNAGSPKGGTGDADGDGIDDACDAGTPLASGVDVDGDGFQNRQDNCPQTANGGVAQTESETAAGDLGPAGDYIGDACDSGSVTVSQNGQPVSVTLSPAVGNGRYHARTNVITKCLGLTPAGGTDADGDGYCYTQDNAESGACAPYCGSRHTAWSGVSHPGLQMDSDGDGYSDVMETYVGTDATKSCAQSAAANNESVDHWPMDGTDNGFANTVDVGGMMPISVYAAVHPKGTRWDLNNDGHINTIDVGRFVAVLNKTCGGYGAPVSTPIPPFSQQ